MLKAAARMCPSNMRHPRRRQIISLCFFLPPCSSYIYFRVYPPAPSLVGTQILGHLSATPRTPLHYLHGSFRYVIESFHHFHWSVYHFHRFVEVSMEASINIHQKPSTKPPLRGMLHLLSREGAQRFLPSSTRVEWNRPANCR